MVYASWKQELEAFERECDRIRQSRRASFPIKVLGLAPLATVPFIAKMPLGRQILAGAGIVISGLSLMSELDRQREAYGGSLKLDLTPNSDWDNLSGAFETRSPRWCALCFLYAQLDPLHLKDRLGHLPDDEGTRVLNRCIKRVQKGLREIAQLNPNKPSYGDELRYLTDEWRGDVSRVLDHALFVAGAIDADDLDPDEFEVEEGEGTTLEATLEPPSKAVQSDSLPPASAINLSAFTDPKERMTALIQRMAQEGFLLGTLLNHPFVWCWGRSQSGKTTIALMLAIARMVMGGKVAYFTTDNDYPREMPWSSVEDSPTGYADALESVREIISSANKGALKGQSWVFDEMLAASAEHSLEIQPLLICVLMKLAKTKGGVIGISQADTSTAHGLKGIDAAWRVERVSVEAIHEENEMGDRYPTGCYRVSKGEASEEWKIPGWMLTEKNQWGQFDPVVWMLKQFPELTSKNFRTHVQSGSSPIQDTPEDDTPMVWDAELDTPLLPGAYLTEEAKRIYAWLRRKTEAGKKQFSVSEVQQGKPLGKDASHTLDIVQPILAELLHGRWIDSDGKLVWLL